MPGKNEPPSQVEGFDTRIRWWNLKFRDPGLEKDYRAAYFDNNINGTRTGLVCAFLVLMAFAIFEPNLLQPPELVNKVRLLFVTPLIILSIIASFTMPQHFYLIMVSVSTAVVSSQIAMLPLLGHETTVNTSLAYLQHLLFVVVLLFQPFRYLLLPVIALSGLMIAALKTYSLPGFETQNFVVAVQGISFVSLLFAYMRERVQRQLFAASAEVALLRDETERQQANQISWLSNLSRYLEHELRNHVFIVQSNLEFLQQDVEDSQRPFVRRAMRSVGKLSDLCDSVGQASTLESALQLDLQHPVNFSRMVAERVLERARDLDETNPLELDVDPDLWVLGSEVRLLQVFDHLLNNALEYSSEDAFVRIEVKSLAGAVYFTVHNRGEPLPEDRNVFAVFESTRPKTNLGMGLYVSRKIVEHHKGSIEARTQLGQTIVMVTLPQVQAPASSIRRSEVDSDNVMSFERLTRDRGRQQRDGGDADRSEGDASV